MAVCDWATAAWSGKMLSCGFRPSSPEQFSLSVSNYADHAKELAFKAPDEPLVFLKGPQSLCGHRGQTRRPRGVTYMHYECELAVVIGKTARKVTKADAYDLRRRLHRRERLRDSRLPGKLLSPELSREEPRLRHAAGPLAGGCRRCCRSDEFAIANAGERPRHARRQYARYDFRYCPR